MNKDIRKPEKAVRKAMSAAKRARAWGMNSEAKAYAAKVYQRNSPMRDDPHSR